MIAARTTRIAARIAASVAAAALCAAPACGPSGARVAEPPAVTLRVEVPAAADIAASERARVGSLAHLHARGVAELRWTDSSGSHFEQGDADVRWLRGTGIAVSVSKLGDRHAWIGTDGRRWWRFEPKAEPSRLVWGRVGEGSVSGGTPSPRALGLAPLLPRDGASPEMRGGVVWVELEPEGPARVEAGFDARSLAPIEVRTIGADGREIHVAFEGFVSVETAGAPEGAWPRIPRRTRATVAGTESSLVVSVDSARADAAAADRPALYDMDALRERFAPAAVEEQR